MRYHKVTNGRKLLLLPQPEGQREEVVEPELRKPGERWNLSDVLHKAEREKRSTLVFLLLTFQPPVIVSSVVHPNRNQLSKSLQNAICSGEGPAIQSKTGEGQGVDLRTNKQIASTGTFTVIF